MATGGVERLSPLGFNRIAVFDKRVRFMEATGSIDASGGFIPGPPKVVATVFAAIEPAQLSRLVKEELAGGAIANSESYHVSCWYVAGIRVQQWIEFDDVPYPPPADGSNPPVTTRRFEIV